MYSPLRRYVAECFGTAALLCAVIGSGIMGENLSGGNVAVALLANTLATVFALFVLIEVFGPISGAHFNPAVSLAMWLTGQLSGRDFLAYVLVQLLGAALGAWLAHAMFDLAILQTADKARTGVSQWLAEVVATTGLLFVIFRMRREAVSLGVALYIGAAYWFTASTSFANPAAVFGRMLSDTFAGIRPIDAFGFCVAQVLGALIAIGLQRFFAEARRF
jgi:glycerol uptake facilitator-like aquaporin